MTTLDRIFEPSNLPASLCTGYGKEVSHEDAKKIGIKAFAYKPIVKADLEG